MLLVYVVEVCSIIVGLHAQSFDPRMCIGYCVPPQVGTCFLTEAFWMDYGCVVTQLDKLGPPHAWLCMSGVRV